MSWRPALTTALVLTSGLAACGGSATTATNASTVTTTSAAEITIAGTVEPVPASSMPAAEEVFDDPGEPVSASVGESFALSLDANPGTGNAWSVTEPADPGVVAGRGHQYSPDPDAEGATALGGSDVWTFEATGPGETSVTLAYGRPGAEPESTTTFRIVVR